MKRLPLLGALLGILVVDGMATTAENIPTKNPTENSTIANSPKTTNPPKNIPAKNPTENSTITNPSENNTTTNPPNTTPGISPTRILFGQSAALSGPAAELGKDMRLGIKAAFEEANQRGGIHGRQLVLISLDDAYEPKAAIDNTRRLIDEEQVFALIGAVGTPTSRAAVPLTRGIPYIAPLTGAEFLRDSSLGNVINLRASYEQETEAMVSRLSSDLGIERIAVLHQDDSFGHAGYIGVVKALARRDRQPAAVGVYPRNTSSIKTGLLSLRRGKPEAVILIGAYKPVATLIKWAQQIGFTPVFVNISFVGSNALARELGPAGAGVFVTQVVPFPAPGASAIATAYTHALKALAPQDSPGFVSFEGYLAGRLAIQALTAIGPEPDRAQFLNWLHRPEPVDLGGFTLHFDQHDNQGSDAVFFTVIDRQGHYRGIEKLTRNLTPQ